MNRYLFTLVLILSFSRFVVAQKNHKLDSLKQVINGLKQKGSSPTTDTLQVNTLCTYAQEKMRVSPESAILDLTEALKLSEKNNYKRGILRTCVLLASSYNNQTMRASEYLLRALVIAEELRSYQDIMMITEMVGYNYYLLHDHKKGLFYAIKHSEYCKRFASKEKYLLSINTIAIFYYELKFHEKMLELLLFCEKENANLKSKKIESAVLINSAKVYIKQKKYELALSNLKKASMVDDGYGDKTGYINNEIAQIFLQQNDLVKALHHAQISHNSGKGINHIIESSSKTLVDIYKKLNRNDLALPYYEKYLQAKLHQDSVKNSQLNRLMVVDYEAEKKTQEVEKLNIDKEETEGKYRALVIILIGVVVVSSVVLYLYRILRKQNKEIEAQNTKIEDLNKNLEKKVADRTKELSEANEELKRKNNEILEAIFKGQKIERDRMAIELHDNLGSTLTSINWLLADFNVSSLTADEKEIYEKITKMTKDAYGDVRDLSHGLIPKVFDDKGLVGALHQRVDNINASNKIDIYFHSDDNVQNLKTTVAYEIYVICSELITNILKHSNASEANLTLLWKNGMIMIDAQDNGKGFEVDVLNSGIGMKNLKERVKTIHPDSSVEVISNNGGRVKVKIPHP